MNKFNTDSFESMKKARGLDFLVKGMDIEVCGKIGKVVGNYGHNLFVRFDHKRGAYNCHPHYLTKYFNKSGELIKEYGK